MISRKVGIAVLLSSVVAMTALAQSNRWTAAEIKTASGREGCQQLAVLPKKLSRNWKLSFISPNKGHPFFGVWSGAMKDAAKFYGASFAETDAAGDYTKVPDLLETMLAAKPNFVGTGGTGPDVTDGVAARLQDLKIPFMGIDTGPNEYSPYVYGIPDNFAGKLGAETLAKGVQARQAADWKGKELFFIEFTIKGFPVCANRTGASAKAFKSAFKLDDKHVLTVDVGTGISGADGMKAILAANKNAVFAFIPCWDGLGFDGYNAAKDSGREKDVLMVTLGGDKPSADLLMTKPVGYYGYVEFQPYCEGWGWVESALGILQGVQIQPYQTRRVTTQATIEARYKELYAK